MSGNQANGQTAGQPSYAELLAMVQKLQAEKDNLTPKGVNFVFGEKGGVTANGLGRFGTTLYLEQWIKLIDAIQGQDFLRMLLTWASKGERLLKGAKDETPQSIMQRTIAFGVSELAKRYPVAPPASVPASQPATPRA